MRIDGGIYATITITETRLHGITYGLRCLIGSIRADEDYVVSRVDDCIGVHCTTKGGAPI